MAIRREIRSALMLTSKKHQPELVVNIINRETHN